jgi:hypothetical protein
MSQRECAGFNWPRFSVGAGEPVGVGPEVVNCAWRGSTDNECPFDGSGVNPDSLFQSRAFGVAQLASFATPPSFSEIESCRPWLYV